MCDIEPRSPIEKLSRIIDGEAYLVGSFARGNPSGTSDVDVYTRDEQDSIPELIDIGSPGREDRRDLHVFTASDIDDVSGFEQGLEKFPEATRIEPANDRDRAPTVYLSDGTPVKVRMVGAECMGDMSGEGHYGYAPTDLNGEEPTVYFDAVDVERDRQ